MKVLDISFQHVVPLISIVRAPQTWYPTSYDQKFRFCSRLLGVKFTSQNIILRSKTLPLYIYKAFCAQIDSRTLKTRLWWFLANFFSLAMKVLGISFQHVVPLMSIVRAPQTWYPTSYDQKFRFSSRALGLKFTSQNIILTWKTLPLSI